MNIHEFKEKVGTSFVIVDFFATWCGPCKMLAQVIDTITDYKVIKVDVDQNEELARLNNINVVPTIQLYKNGNMLAQKSGYMSYEELIKFIERYK